MAIDEPILSLGSCFSTEVGQRLKDGGRDILINPFGVLYNPASIANSVKMLSDPAFRFTATDVIERDPYYCAKRNAKAAPEMPQAVGVAATPEPATVHRPVAPCIGGYTSFCHHGSFTRPTPEEFLRDANAALTEVQEYWQKARTVIITFGTAWVFRHIERNMIVSNCHKHRADEFKRERLTVEEINGRWNPIIEESDKQWIFTVSPIRHLKDGLHGNQISKSTLILACDELTVRHPGKARYFPSYEIMMDELRDYRWYKDDKIHPSEEAVDYITDKFWEQYTSSFLPITSIFRTNYSSRR